MGYTKDLWTRPEKQEDGAVKRVPNARWGKGKRWLACWLDPDEREVTKAFTNKTPADKYWQKQEADRDRGEYVDPKAGREKVEALAKRWLDSISVDPATWAKYEQVWRLHVKPKFGNRSVKSMTKPSEVQAFLTGLGRTLGDSTVNIARYVLGGMLELAVADEDLRKNPVRSRVVTTTKTPAPKITVWGDDVVWALIDAHPDSLRALPYTGATTGCREGELYGLAEDDIDFERELIHVRRQIKRIDKTWCLALPKNDQERDVPMGAATAAELRAHMAKYKPVLVTLPWEKPDGERRTLKLIFLHPDSGEHLRESTYNAFWRPAIQAAGVIGPPVKDPRGRGTTYAIGSRKHGRHQLRHYYANLQLAGGTNIRELADYLGHADPAFTLRVYGHLQPDSHERARKAVDTRFFRPRAVSDGTGTEQG